MADDLNDYLQGLPDQLEQVLSDAIKKEADDLSSAQRRALQALEQSPDETGDLLESCQVVPGENSLEFIVQAGGDLTTEDGYDRALAFEFGTSRQPARGFFWPTYRERKEKIQENIATAIEKVLK